MIYSVAFIDEKLKTAYEEIKDKKLLKYLQRAIDDLKKDPFAGIKIPRKLWPKEYIKKYNVKNLWKYNLPDGWRIIYTLKTNEIEIISIILEWFTHKEYEKRFKY